MNYETRSRLVHFNPVVIAMYCLVAAVSCSPANRVSRIIARNPHIKTTSVADTFYQDSFYEVDTFRVTQTDTFTRNDTTFIRTSDTIRLERKCPVIRQRQIVYLPDTSQKTKTKPKDATKGRERKVREGKPVKERTEGFFGRIQRYAANGFLLFFFVIGYAIGGVVTRALRRFEE
jgi:hypothetical protein